MSDPQKYRSKEEVEEYKAKDPIALVLATIKEHGLATDADLDKIMTKVKGIVEESVKFAEESPEPAKEELYEDVYTQEDYPFIKE